MHATALAVITGASRGLGLETARQLLARGWHVVVSARSLDDASAACAELGQGAIPFELDVTDPEQCAALATFVDQRFGRLDTLVNNAGAIFDDPGANDLLASTPEALEQTFHNNTVGAFNVARACLPLLRARGGGNLVNVSSGMGGLEEMGPGYVGYRLSKTALNALTRILDVEHGGAGVRANSVCPGWVRTEMGGPSATRDVPEGAAGIVWAATLGPGDPRGGFFRDGEPIPW